MFDPDKLLKIKEGSAFQSIPTNLDKLTEAELFALHDEVTQRLPPASLKVLNLETELVRQYQRALALQADALDDESVPANQKALLLNAVSGTLNRLVEMQAKYHTTERLKAIEGSLIKALKVIPDEHIQAFLDEYEHIGEENEL